MAIRLWRMRSSVSRSTLHVVGEQQVEVLQNRAGEAVFDRNDALHRPTRWRARQRHRRRGRRERSSASGNDSSAASWLNEPGSPWMAIFIPVSASLPFADAAGAVVAWRYRAECFLAPYHSSTAAFIVSCAIRRCHQRYLPQPQIGGDKDEKDHGDDAVHGEECGIQAAQVARRNDGVLIGQQQADGGNAQPAGDAESEQRCRTRPAGPAWPDA